MVIKSQNSKIKTYQAESHAPAPMPETTKPPRRAQK